MKTNQFLSALGTALALIVSAVGTPLDAGASPTQARDQTQKQAQDYRLLIAPDFLNTDLADLRAAPQSGWRPGKPNSWNPAYARAMRTAMNDFAATDPDAVVVPGDLVNGHWDVDPQRQRLFGSTQTPAQRRQAMRRAASVYYPAWRARFAARGLPVYTTTGDHEYGDNRWKGSPRAIERAANHRLWRGLYAKHMNKRPDGSFRFADHPQGPSAGSAYATRPRPDVQLVMLDVFRYAGRSQGIVPEVDQAQLRWLRGVLARAQRDGVKWTVVAGHTPIVGPVRKNRSSSGLMYRGGTRSPLWQVMKRHGVDLYLSGEAHGTSAHSRDGITQLTTGGIFGYGGSATHSGGSSFAVLDLGEHEATIRSYGWSKRQNKRARLWQAGKSRPPAGFTIGSKPIRTGSLSITAETEPGARGERVSSSDGLLEVPVG